MVANFTYLLDQNNYGQRLQNYAIHEFLLEEFGETMVTMDYAKSRKGANLEDDRYFHRFEREMLHIADIRSEGAGMLSGFDHILIGGDQVFNTDLRTSWEFLPYISNRPDKRRNVFSYAAGLSRNHVVNPDFLKGIELQTVAFGLREDCAGLDYVKNIDPVFLIKPKWDEVAIGEYPEGGTVKYILGGNGGVAELSRTDLEGNTLFAAGNGERVPDPRVFLGLFRGASKAVTNSFHGFCFALINRVRRIDVLNPDDHRVVNLNNVLGIENEDGEVKNYDEIHERIQNETSKSRIFMEKCLNSKIIDYCTYSKSSDARRRSSSGGATPELARRVISCGGVVYGGAFSDDFRKVVPASARTMEEYFSKLSKSKYSFCALPDIDGLKKELSDGAPVMYVGSPCHVNALMKLIGEAPENLILVDFRCRGYSSPARLRSLVDYIEQENKCRVSGLDFRPRHRCEIEAALENGRRIRLGSGVFNKFIYNVLPMCRKCPFAHGYGLSCADITVSDFWANAGDRHALGKEFTPEAGCTRVSVNTEKGWRLWSSAKSNLEYLPVLKSAEPDSSGKKAVLPGAGKDYMVWISYHDDSLIGSHNLKNDEHHRIFPVHKDALLENINRMHPVWCELVTVWYVYHNNIKSDIVGFSHYRRQIRPSRLPKKGQCAIFTEFGVVSPYIHYKASHHSKDMDEVIGILDRRYGIGNPYSLELRQAGKVIGCNCFMMVWEDFIDLCEYLFPVILEYSEATGCGMDPDKWRSRAAEMFKGSDAARIKYQTRVVGFLAERLVSAYIHTNMSFYY